MTQATINLIDTYCNAANWQGSIDGLPDFRDVDPRYREEMRAEIVEWSKRRDKALAKLTAINDALTDHEKEWVRRRCGGDQLAASFRKLGIAPSWDDGGRKANRGDYRRPGADLPLPRALG